MIARGGKLTMTEHDVLLCEHEQIQAAQEWLLEKDIGIKGNYYVTGVNDLADRILRRMRGEHYV